MSSKFKKTISLIITGIIMISCFSLVAMAFGTPAVYVNLTAKQTVARSETTAGTYKVFGGSNSSKSNHKVYFSSQRSSGSGFVNDVEVLVPQGKTIDNIYTSNSNTTVLWRLELNPYGVATAGCIANGSMWYKM